MLIKEAQILGLDYIDELNVDYTDRSHLRVWNITKTMGCEGIPAEVWDMLISKMNKLEFRWSCLIWLKKEAKIQENGKLH